PVTADRGAASAGVTRRGNRELCQSLGQSGIPVGVGGQRTRGERRQQVPPYQVELVLNAADVARENDNGVLVGKDDRQLSSQTVQAKRIVSTVPDLITVASLVVAPLIRRRRRVVVLDVDAGEVLDIRRG